MSEADFTSRSQIQTRVPARLPVQSILLQRPQTPPLSPNPPPAPHNKVETLPSPLPPLFKAEVVRV